MGYRQIQSQDIFVYTVHEDQTTRDRCVELAPARDGPRGEPTKWASGRANRANGFFFIKKKTSCKSSARIHVGTVGFFILTFIRSYKNTCYRSSAFKVPSRFY